MTMSAILKFDFKKKKKKKGKKTITFFWSKLSKLHKKRPNFAYVTTTFSLKQGKKEQTVYPFHTP